ncbi:hypothetical protein B0H21DRAFT_728665 [Amylocystis lapponica]|nr:hypothetical protein B0H21DRAFT_728665 [Amylocystis lapponica]
MSRRVIPFIVAAVTGVASGIYIFKPLLEKESVVEVDGSNASSPNILVSVPTTSESGPIPTAAEPNQSVKRKNEPSANASET